MTSGRREGNRGGRGGGLSVNSYNLSLVRGGEEYAEIPPEDRT